MKKVAIVTGGNRGLGLALVEKLAKDGYEVILGTRNLKSGEEAAFGLIQQGLTIRIEKLDVSSEQSVIQFFSKIKNVDLLINNAATYAGNVLKFNEVDEDSLFSAINTNALGAWRMCKAASILMTNQKYGRIINISTGWASLNEMEGSSAAYRISKVALNAITLVVAHELKNKGDIKVNSVCPGWIRTRMGGNDAPLNPKDAVADVLWAGFLNEEGVTGGFFRGRKQLQW